ncbi:MAG: virulence protein RhuM/Fic/DOC family protein [Actinomycetota bacterium]
MNKKISAHELSGEVVVYEAPDGNVRVEVVVGDDTVLLTQKQMSDLFGTSTDNVGLHVQNAYHEGELIEDRTTEDSSVVRSEGGRQIRRRIQHYNLDMIISVGYRIKSKRGTQFRIWATNTLRDHLIQGYTLNEKRLQSRGVEMEQALALLSSTLRNQHLITDEGQAVLDVVQRYARSWRLLREYDEDQLSAAPEQASAPIAELDIAAARIVIRSLRDDMVARGEAPGLFGQERGDGLESILLNIEQTFGGEPLYPTIESRAAHLLYFVIKNHPLTDGNKRSGSLLFLEYLRRNNALSTSTGEPRFSDIALVGLALLVAESKAENKDLIIRLVLNLLVEDRG